MSRAEKALAKVLSAQSDKNTTFDELHAAFLHAGWTLDRVNGSHHIYRAPDGRILTVPKHGKDVKSPYIRQARELLK